MKVGKGGEVHEMDVSPRNSLLDVRFFALVLSRTLNGSSEGRRKIEELKGPAIWRGLFVCVPWILRLSIPSPFFLEKFDEKRNDSLRGN